MAPYLCLMVPLYRAEHGKNDFDSFDGRFVFFGKGGIFSQEAAFGFVRACPDRLGSTPMSKMTICPPKIAILPLLSLFCYNEAIDKKGESE